MIDLHSHILPGIDDGAKDIGISIEMAKIAVADGTNAIACTPHFLNGVYDTDMAKLASAMHQLQGALEREKIPLKLIVGGDIHVNPGLVDLLAQKKVPTLGGTKYFLFEPPHHVAPPNLPQLCKKILQSGYVPILTHPERLRWIEQKYDIVCELHDLGVPIQLTAKAVTGQFGKRPLYWSERMLNEGRVELIASDAHNATSRPPGLSEAKKKIIARWGERATQILFDINPVNILKNAGVEKLPEPSQPKQRGSKKRLFFFR